MFTGIIEATAEILERTDQSLTIARPKAFDDLKIGASIAISGVCLSIVDMDSKYMTFDVIPTTWSKTKLGTLKKGDLVNLERAMPASGRFDGHVVQGHCEGMATIKKIQKDGDDVGIELSYPDALKPYIVAHGSITLDGVSLTVSARTDDSFSVSLIPHTLAQTTFSQFKAGDTVNIETDIIGRYILSSHAR